MMRMVLVLAAIVTLAAIAQSGVTRELVRLAPVDAAADERAVAAIASASPLDAFTPAFFKSGGLTLPYRLLSPPTVVPGERYPLVLVFHGSGAIGTDNRAQLGAFARAWGLPDVRRRFPAFVVVPQFGGRSATYGVDSADGLPSSEATAWLDAALALVTHIQATHPVDPRRLYVVGFSMGASTTWHALLRRPGVFAAAVPIAAIPPARSFAPGLAAVPILIVHGNADTENPIPADRAMFDALIHAGSRTVRFREYEGLDHRVPPDLLDDAAWRTWLFAQHRDGL